MAKPDEDGEMSIEEILASIRRYVGEETTTTSADENANQKQPPNSQNGRESLASVKGYSAGDPSIANSAEQSSGGQSASASHSAYANLYPGSSSRQQNLQPATLSHTPISNSGPENVIHLTDAYALRPGSIRPGITTGGEGDMPRGDTNNSKSPQETQPHLMQEYQAENYQGEKLANYVPRQTEGADNNLMSFQARSATTNSFARLAEATLQAQNRIASTKNEQNSPTLDQVFAKLAQPMIKEWLEQHLPRLVEVLVAKEIANLTKSLQRE